MAVWEKYNLFADNLSLLLSVKDISALQVSSELGMKSYRINDLQLKRNGKPKPEELEAIARYFKISVDQLINQKATASITFKPIKNDTRK